MLAEHEACVTHHHEDEIESYSPQGADDNYAADALGLQDAVSDAGTGGCARKAGSPHGESLVAGGDPLVGSDGDVNVRDIVGRGREACGVVDGLATGSGRFAAGSVAVMLGNDQEPGDGESGGVGSVDGGIEYVEAGQR